MRVGAVIQARMTSTRLPGKVARELPYGSGITVLEQVVRRLKKCRQVDEVIVASTTDRSDAPLARLAARAGAMFFRGSREDVLDRYYRAARRYSLGTIVRITSDCPCVDPALVDSLVKKHLAAGADYTANVIEQTFPDGYDVEVLSSGALSAAFSAATARSDREHVTSYLRERPSEFRVVSVKAPAWGRRPELRVTLDTSDDYLLLCAVYDQLYSPSRPFSLRDVIRMFRRKPWMEQMNRRSLAKKGFPDMREELVHAATLLELQELGRAAALLRKALKK